ncbi:hypothetical protein DU508_18495 [Pedobacter chinensis]|uniref:Uncharacterized protein n=1 Tax=Pedobacter chinensis TaxID=2282421 RepID=A0A369PR77_9SPHI|nr:hypothetical protein [Pedobacter chinensis]RDC55141.1 hypothetical protein DU508_18495 [Pedobacter chinensis]
MKFNYILLFLTVLIYSCKKRPTNTSIMEYVGHELKPSEYDDYFDKLGYKWVGANESGRIYYLKSTHVSNEYNTDTLDSYIVKDKRDLIDLSSFDEFGIPFKVKKDSLEYPKDFIPDSNQKYKTITFKTYNLNTYLRVIKDAKNEGFKESDENEPDLSGYEVFTLKKNGLTLKHNKENTEKGIMYRVVLTIQ